MLFVSSGFCVCVVVWVVWVSNGVCVVSCCVVWLVFSVVVVVSMVCGLFCFSCS